MAAKKIISLEDHPARRLRWYRQEHDGLRVRRRHGARRRWPHVPRRFAARYRPGAPGLHLRSGERGKAPRHHRHSRPRGPHRFASVSTAGPQQQGAHLLEQADARLYRGQAMRCLHGFGQKPWEGIPREITGLKVGIVGLGKSGGMIADAMKFFGADIAYYARSEKKKPVRRVIVLCL